VAGLVCTSRHYRKMLGLKDEAAAMDRKYREMFGALRLFPLVAVEAAIDTENLAEYTKAVAAASALARAHPEAVTDLVLTRLHEKQDFAPVQAGVPASPTWFAPYFPVGTAFEPRRVYSTNTHVRVDLARLEALKSIAPYERDFVLRYVDAKFGLNPGVDVFRREIGSLADYDSRAAWKIARAATDTPEVYLPIVRRLAEAVDPENWYWVAEYLAERGQESEALAAFERYRQEARDRVGVSDRSDWFVKLLLRQGQRSRAFEMAKEAAEVYSYVGLTTYADALDMSGDTRRAERLYREAAERYYASRDGALLAFLERHQTDSADYAAEARELAAKVFPKGRQAVSAPSLTGVPDGGVRVFWSSFLGKQNGVHDGDVIVGVDGTRVRDRSQYVAVKYLSWKPEMRFLVWRDGKYLEVPTRLRHRWMASSLTPYYPGQ
jgi:tetratricopeptide (TPR) repeat protein